jgi:anti-sigma factor RsiW
MAWASSQVESMADGSLSPTEEQRMRAAMSRDPALRAAVERAVALRYELRALDRIALPSGLARRLLANARTQHAGRRVRPPPWRWGWLAGAAATLLVAAGTFGVLEQQKVREREAAAAREREAAAALEQVELAMMYLRRTSELAGEHVREAVRTGFLAALQTSREAMEREDSARADGDGA